MGKISVSNKIKYLPTIDEIIGNENKTPKQIEILYSKLGYSVKVGKLRNRGRQCILN